MTSPYTPLFQEFLKTKPVAQPPENIYDRYFNWLIERGLSQHQAWSDLTTNLEIISVLMD